MFRVMFRFAGALAGVIALGAAAYGQHVPPAGDEAWERRDPASLGLDPEALQSAIDLAIAHETRHPPELEAVSPASDLSVTVPLNWAFEPFSSPIGPFKSRGPATGIILKDGYIVAEWGAPERVDMTFSVTKTFLSHVVGLAIEDGLIESVDDPVSVSLDDPRFHTEHNAPITWDQMLRQTSGWWGNLFGKPAWADRPSREDPASDLVAGPPEPGAHWEYNDVRVNALALAALHVFERPLPEVLRDRVMEPIGVTSDWVWHGYENSYVMINGEEMQSVSGGGHWGGGMWLTAYDQARLGLLGARMGDWGGDQILAESWYERSLTPTGPFPSYGHMNFFLNRPDDERASIRVGTAPESAFAYLGAGSNMVFISPDHDLVAVVRWIDGAQRNAFLEQLMAAVQD
ncbi:MAG: serine hydrolase domain-containing protein [Oceanicaulis sp.]